MPSGHEKIFPGLPAREGAAGHLSQLLCCTLYEAHTSCGPLSANDSMQGYGWKLTFRNLRHRWTPPLTGNSGLRTPTWPSSDYKAGYDFQCKLLPHSPPFRVKLASGLKALSDFLDPTSFSLRRLSPGKILFLEEINKYHVLMYTYWHIYTYTPTHIYGIKKKMVQMNLFLQGRSRDTDMGNTLVDTVGKREGWANWEE